MSFLKNNFFVAVGNVGIKIHTFILMSVLINFISLAAYSDYVIILSFVSFLTGISSFGVGFYYKRYFPSAETKKMRQNLFYPQFIVTLIFSTLIIIILIITEKFIILELFNNKIGINYFLILGYFITYVLYSQTTDFYRYSNQMLLYSILTLITPYIWLIWILFLKEFFPQIISLNLVIGSIIIVMNLINLSLMYHIQKTIGISTGIFVNYHLLKDIGIGLPLVMVIIANWIITAFDRFFILQYLDKIKVGFYSAAYSIGSLINFFPLVLGVIMPPMLSIMVDKNNDTQAQKYVNYSIIGFLGFAIPFCAGAFFTGENILGIISKSSICLESKYVIVMIGLGASMSGLVIILSTILFVQEKTKRILYAAIIGMVVSIILNSVLLPKFQSIIICSIVNFISNLLSFIFISFGLLRNSILIINYKSINKILLSTLIMSIVLLIIVSYFKTHLTSNIIQLFTKILLGGCVYVLSILYFFPKHVNNLLKMSLETIKSKS